AGTAYSRGDRAVRPAPAEDQSVRSAGIVDLQLGDVLRDARHLLRPQARHAVVVFRVVADVARNVLLLQASDAMLEACRPWDRPRPRQGRLVAPVGLEAVAIRLGETRVDRRDRLDVRQEPGLRAVREVGVREQEYRRPVLDGDPRSLERSVEAVGRSRSRDYR